MHAASHLEREEQFAVHEAERAIRNLVPKSHNAAIARLIYGKICEEFEESDGRAIAQAQFEQAQVLLQRLAIGASESNQSIKSRTV